jgi:hypothetical protein
MKAPKPIGMMENFFNPEESRRHLRIKARLMRGENIPQPLTETFIYDFIQQEN